MNREYSPATIAAADQHVAAIDKFLRNMVDNWKQLQTYRTLDSVDACELSNLMRGGLSAEALSDALACAIRALASQPDWSLDG